MRHSRFPRYTVLWHIRVGSTHWQRHPGCHEKAPGIMVISMKPDIKTGTSPDAKKKCGIVQLLQRSTVVEQPFTHVMSYS